MISTSLIVNHVFEEVEKERNRDRKLQPEFEKQTLFGLNFFGKKLSYALRLC